MASLIDRVVATAPGKLAFKIVQPLIHMARRSAHPDIPTDHKVTKVSYRGKDFSIVHRRTFPDNCVIEQCFGETQYDIPRGPHGELIDRIYNQIIASGHQPLIIDCGSNIGASVLWFSARYPRAHIVAIEPAPDNFALLKRNTAGLDIEPVHAGIAPNDGTARIADPGKGGYAYQTTTEADTGTEVAMVSIPTLLSTKPASQYTPFILKVDIEGYEEYLFTGDTSSINLFPLIVMEPHDWMLPGKLSSLPFFRFHAEAGREFAMKAEIVASIAVPHAQSAAQPVPQVETADA